MNKLAHTICGHTVSENDILVRYEDRDACYYKCPRCGSIFLEPIPTEVSNEWFTGKEAADRMERTDQSRIAYFNTRLDWLDKYTKRDATQGVLFEIGCGAGEFLRQARQRGWDVYGIDLSDELVNRARAFNPDSTIHTAMSSRARWPFWAAAPVWSR